MCVSSSHDARSALEPGGVAPGFFVLSSAFGCPRSPPPDAAGFDAELLSVPGNGRVAAAERSPGKAFCKPTRGRPASTFSLSALSKLVPKGSTQLNLTCDGSGLSSRRCMWL